MKLITWLKGAFEAHSLGASARKLSAFIIIVMVVISHIKWFKSDHWEYLTVVLGLDYTFILVCLGLATWQYLKESKDKSKDDKN